MQGTFVCVRKLVLLSYGVEAQAFVFELWVDETSGGNCIYTWKFTFHVQILKL